MSPIAISLILFACVFGGAVAGVLLRDPLRMHRSLLPAPRGPAYPIEDTVGAMAKLVEEGKAGKAIRGRPRDRSTISALIRRILGSGAPPPKAKSTWKRIQLSPTALRVWFRKFGQLYSTIP